MFNFYRLSLCQIHNTIEVRPGPCIVFKPQLYKLSCLTFYMNNEKLDYTDSIKYLGFTFSSDKKDDNDMLRQMRIIYQA